MCAWVPFPALCHLRVNAGTCKRRAGLVCGYDHSYLADALRRCPGRFAGVGLVDPLAPDAPARLTDLAQEVGLWGLRLNPSTDPQGAWLDDPRTYPLWEKAGELGIVVSALILPHQMGRLESTAERFPGVTVVVDHLGRAPAKEGLPYRSFQAVRRLARLPNTYLKISGIPVSSSEGYPYRDVHPMIELALASFGRERLMWATDFPWILRQCGYAPALRLLQDEMPFTSVEDRQWILGRTVQRLFWLDE